MVGTAVGVTVGVAVGLVVGLAVGVDVGEAVGVGDSVGVAVTVGVGLAVAVGVDVGMAVGLAVGVDVGEAVGDAVGVEMVKDRLCGSESSRTTKSFASLSVSTPRPNNSSSFRAILPPLAGFGAETPALSVAVPIPTSSTTALETSYKTTRLSVAMFPVAEEVDE